MDVQRKAPQQVNYQDILPLAIPASSNRRKFFPNNGGTFNPTTSNIIRIDVNADSMLDAASSYLQLTLKNTDATANNVLSLDYGCPYIKRLRIESGGVQLEDINEYHRLYCMLELAQFAPDNFQNEMSVLLGQSEMVDKAVDAAPVLNNAWTNSSQAGQTIGASASRTFCVPLVSALLNCDKYIPLILANAGITLEITLASGSEVGVESAAANDAATIVPQYEVSNVAYVAHLVDLDRSFYDALRAEMAMTGSVALNGQTWRHFSGNVPANGGSATINIPARQKSIKSIFTTARDSAYSTGAGTGLTSYAVGTFQRQDISAWNYKIGSVNYPQANVAVSATELAPTLCEVLKAFGKLGSIETNTCFSSTTFSANSTAPDVKSDRAAAGGAVQAFVIGYDTEAFQKTALESGINTAERALPISLELTFASGGAGGDVSGPQVALTTDTYVCSDWFGYINADGTITPSV
jgi:hypothetical protein